MRKTFLGLFAFLMVGVLVLAGCGGGAGEGGGEAAPEPAATEPAAPAAAAAPSGTAVITGTVTYAGAVPSLKPIDMSADPVCASKHDAPVPNPILVLGDGNTMANIFVRVTNPPEGDYPTPADKVVIDQAGCMYHPHVVAMMTGQTLEFKNSDGLLHNVHGLPKHNREFNLGMPASLTESDANAFTEPELPPFEVKCDVHPWMKAFVAVVPNPFFDVTGEDGQFRIEGLPAGTYTVEIWQERLGTKSTQVTVADGETATADFEMSPPQG
jgi:plastocyanin